MAAGRQAAFDIARGIAIIAVAVGHSFLFELPQPVLSFCFSFHMPLFFIISGYFLKTDAVLDGTYLRKNAHALLVPYAATCAAVLLLELVGSLIMYPGELGMRMRDMAIASLYGAGADNGALPKGVFPIGAVWFFLALFWARIALPLLHRMPLAAKLAVMAALFALGYCTSTVFWAPLSIQAGLCAIPWVYLGQVLRRWDVFAPGRIHPLAWVAIVAGWACAVIWGGYFYMVNNAYNDGLLDVIGGICGTLTVVKASQLLERHLPQRTVAPLARLGSNTMPFLCAHLIEMDVFPWGITSGILAKLPVPMWLPGLALRFAVIAALMVAMWFAPRPVCGWFFPQRTKKS